jgi:hypothetical protein
MEWVASAHKNNVFRLQSWSLTGVYISRMTTRTEIVQSTCVVWWWSRCPLRLGPGSDSGRTSNGSWSRVVIRCQGLWSAASQVQSLPPATLDISRSSWTADCKTQIVQKSINVYIRNSLLYTKTWHHTMLIIVKPMSNTVIQVPNHMEWLEYIIKTIPYVDSRMKYVLVQLRREIQSLQWYKNNQVNFNKMVIHSHNMKCSTFIVQNNNLSLW